MQSKWNYGTFMLFLQGLFLRPSLSLFTAHFNMSCICESNGEKLLLFCNHDALHKNIIFHRGPRVRTIFPKQLQRHFRRRNNNCYMHGRIFIIVICLALHQSARSTQMWNAKTGVSTGLFCFLCVCATLFVARVIVYSFRCHHVDSASQITALICAIPLKPKKNPLEQASDSFI